MGLGRHGIPQVSRGMETATESGDASSKVITSWASEAGSPVSNKGKAKKLRLFGFELDHNEPATVDAERIRPENYHKECDEAIQDVIGGHVSPPVLKMETQGEKCSAGNQENKRYCCQFCVKEFPSSQALGGHQNAHKKERMKKKRMELQARRASLCHYLQPFIQSHAAGFENSTSWHCDPSRSASEFILFEASRGCFGAYYQHTHESMAFRPDDDADKTWPSPAKPSLPSIPKRKKNNLELCLS